MNKRTHITRAIHAAGEKAKYDKQVKEVITECIEGEPEIDSVQVYPGQIPEAITGNDTSDICRR